MPVSRGYINSFAADPDDNDMFQAFTDVANFADALEQAIGQQVGAGQASSLPTPGSAGWTIAAANGHFMVQITNPAPAAGASQPPIQHQVASAVDLNFNTNSAVTTYTLGLGELTRDIVDPGVTKYFRIRSRFPGSTWNNWMTYSTAAGVVALSPGVLKTS